MAALIEAIYSSGYTLKAIVRSKTEINKIWSVLDGVFVLFNGGQWANGDYHIPLTEDNGTGYYSAEFPNVSPVGKYTIVVYLSPGGSPSVSDVIVSIGSIAWTGSEEDFDLAHARIGEGGVGLGNLGDARLANLNATVSSRMATFALPANFSALSINGSGLVTLADASFTSAKVGSGALDSVWSTASRTLTAATNLVLPANALSNISAWTVNLTGNLSGSVGSVTTPVALAGTQSFDNTGNWTGNIVGNLSGSVGSLTGYTAPDNASIAAVKVVTDKLNTALVLDGSVYQYTANALELTPASSGSGLSGPNSVVLTFVDASAAPVPLVAFTVVGQGVGRALVNGTASFGLLSGTYSVVAAPINGMIFPITTLVVAGNVSQTITGTAVSTVSPPADASMCRVFGYVETLNNLPAAGIEIIFELISNGPVKSNKALSRDPIKIRTNKDGQIATGANLYAELQRNDLLTPANTHYLVTCAALKIKTTAILSASTFDIATLIQ